MKQTYRVVVETKEREEIRRYEILTLTQAERRAKIEDAKLEPGQQTVIEKEETYD